MFTLSIHRVKDPDWNTSHVIQVNQDTTSIALQDLYPYTFYQIRVVAKNGLGNSPPSSSSSIFNTNTEGNGFMSLLSCSNMCKYRLLNTYLCQPYMLSHEKKCVNFLHYVLSCQLEVLSCQNSYLLYTTSYSV